MMTSRENDLFSFKKLFSLFVSKFKPYYCPLSSASGTASGKDEKTGHKTNSNNNNNKDEKETGSLRRPNLAKNN